MRKRKNVVKIIIFTLILMVFALVSIFPFYWMILNSFKQPLDIFKVPVDIFTFDLTLIVI